MSYCLTEIKTSKEVKTLATFKPNVRNPRTTSGTMGQWSSGYDVALTTRRSPVQFRLGPSNLFFVSYYRFGRKI